MWLKCTSTANPRSGKRGSKAGRSYKRSGGVGRFYRVLTSSGSRTTMQLVELAASLGETLTSLSVQNTTLDDVFVHYTGRQLRDEQVKAHAFIMPDRPGMRHESNVCHCRARDAQFFRSPILMIMSMMLPLVQLIILATHLGEDHSARGVVDYDHGRNRSRSARLSPRSRQYQDVQYHRLQRRAPGREDVRTGKIDAAVIIPAQFHAVLLAGCSATRAVVDNSDQFTSGSLEVEMQSLVDALNAPVIQPKIVNNIALEIVELTRMCLYEISACRSIALAMYISVMIGADVIYRRQGAWCSRGISCNSDHQA